MDVLDPGAALGDEVGLGERRHEGRLSIEGEERVRLRPTPRQHTRAVVVGDVEDVRRGGGEYGVDAGPLHHLLCPLPIQRHRRTNTNYPLCF